MEGENQTSENLENFDLGSLGSLVAIFDQLSCCKSAILDGNYYQKSQTCYHGSTIRDKDLQRKPNTPTLSKS